MLPLLVSVLVGGLLPILLLPSLAHRPRQPTGKAPLELLPERFRAPTGIAVGPGGTLYFTDEEEGSLFRRDPTRGISLLTDRLKAPRGLVWVQDQGEEGTLYLVAERWRESQKRPRPQGVLLKQSPADGTLSVVASGFQHPQHLFRDPDGSLLLSTTEGLRPSGSRPKDDDDSDDEDDRRKQQARKSDPFPGVVFRVTPADVNPAAPIVPFYPGFRRPAGLASIGKGSILVAAEGYKLGGRALQGSLFRIDPTGQVTTFLAERFQEPAGLIQDALGAFYLAVKEAQEKDDKEDEEKKETPDDGLILKVAVAPDGTATYTYFAAGFERPWGLALDAQGNLYVSDPEAGRIYRFLAPEPPTVPPVLPPTNQSHITLSGTSEPQNRITVWSDQAEVAICDRADGSFTCNNIPLLLNQSNTLTVYATGANGDGLTSAPATTTIFYDGTPPDTQITSGPSGQISQTTATFTFTGTDNLTPPGDLVFSWRVERLDGGQFTPFSPFSPATTATVTDLDPGSYRFEVKVRDLAENEDPTPTHRAFTVSLLSVTITDPTPPPDHSSVSVPAGLLLVLGTVKAGGAEEVGVTVNGIPAAVQGTAFAALVPVTPETKNLTALAITTAGATATHPPITITVEGTSGLTLLASPQSGVAPLTVTFSLLGAPAGAITLDFDDGKGPVNFPGPSLEGQPFEYTQPRLYIPRVTVTDLSGNRFTATAVVQVFDRTALDLFLQRKWADFRSSLSRKEVEGAVAFIVDGQKEKYRRAFQGLAPDLPSIAATLRDINFETFEGGIAEYVTTQDRDGGRFIHFIYFMQDQDGLWKIVAM